MLFNCCREGPTGLVAVVCALGRNLRVRAVLSAVLFAHAGCLVLLGPAGGPADARAQGFVPSAMGPAGVQVCVSLRELARGSSAEVLAPDIANLAGINWIDGFLVDDAGRDVVLLGRVVPGRPGLHLDDLVVNLRNIWNREAYPNCSLDPRPEDVLEVGRIKTAMDLMGNIDALRQQFQKAEALWGAQTVAVGGVPRESRVAHTMIDADYLMKKVSQGLVAVEGIQSWLDMTAEDIRRESRGPHQPRLPQPSARFWFHLDRAPACRFAERIVWLDRCRLIVDTRSQEIGLDGRLQDCEQANPDAALFASQMSERFPAVAATMPVFADLENLVRLNAVLRAAYLSDLVTPTALDFKYWLGGYRYRAERPMPDSLPGLTNAREERSTKFAGGKVYEFYKLPWIYGGVVMDSAPDRESFIVTGNEPLARLRRLALRSRPGPAALWWLVPALGEQ